MKTVSFQGVQLSAGQLRQQAFQQSVRASFLNADLLSSTDQALAAAAVIRDREDSRFFFDRATTDELVSQLRRVSAFCAVECLERR